MTSSRFAPPAQVSERLEQYTILTTVRVADISTWLAEHGRSILPRDDRQSNLVWPWPYTQTPILLVKPLPQGE